MTAELKEGEWVWWQAAEDEDCDNLMDALIEQLGPEFSTVRFDAGPFGLSYPSVVKTSELSKPPQPMEARS